MKFKFLISKLISGENGKSRGCGIIEFPTEELAKLAVEKMHRYEYKGRKISVQPHCEKEDREKGNSYFLH